MSPTSVLKNRTNALNHRATLKQQPLELIKTQSVQEARAWPVGAVLQYPDPRFLSEKLGRGEDHFDKHTPSSLAHAHLFSLPTLLLQSLMSQGKRL